MNSSTILKLASYLFVSGMAASALAESPGAPAVAAKSVPAAFRPALQKALAADGALGIPSVTDSSAWLEQKVSADDGTYLGAFGWSFAMEGNTALIGAYYQTIGANSFQGAVYVFTESNGVWTQTQELTASDGAGGDNFGTSVAIDGDTVLIGAPSVAIGSNLNVGAAYVFTRSGGTWIQGQKLMADDGAASSTFGISVAVRGSMTLIGAHGAAINGQNSQGAVYAFTASGGTWSQAQKLVASDGVASDQFGQQLSLDAHGTTVVIGSDQATYADSFPGTGAAYVFNLQGDTWTQTQRLEADDGQLADYFGRWTAIQGSTIVIGAPASPDSGGNPFMGSAYVFTESGGTWTQTQKLTADDGVSGDFFADAVAIAGNTILIGAPGATIGGNPFVGAAYVYSFDGASWNQSDKIVPSDGAYGDEFGYAVALRDDLTALVGSPHPTDDGSGSTGAAYFYMNDTIFANGFEATP